MKVPTILLVLAFASVAMAGCTSTPTPANTTGNTTSTPAASTPASTPVTPTTPGNSVPPSDITFTASQTAPPGPNATNISYKFEGPERAAAGWVTIHLINNGFEPHQAALFNLGDVPYGAFVAGLMAPANASSEHDMNMTGPMPAGGVGGAFPFSNSTATVHLDAGTYAVVCFIPDPAGVPHAMHGMVRKLMVENTTATPAAEPTTSIVLTASDYKFNLSQNLSAGQQTIKFVNNGTHHHEAALVKLAPNATAKDFTDFFAPGNTPTGPPPATALMGAGTQVPGMHEYFSGNLTAGHWAFLCFEQDSATSPPHFVLGMVLEFDIA